MFVFRAARIERIPGDNFLPSLKLSQCQNSAVFRDFLREILLLRMMRDKR